MSLENILAAEIAAVPEVADATPAPVTPPATTPPAEPTKDNTPSTPPAEGKENTETPPVDPNKPAEENKPAEFKPLKVLAKVYGKEQEVEIKTEADLQALIQKGIASDTRFAEVSQAAQEVEQYREQIIQAYDQLKNNPVGVLQELGVDVRKLAEEYIAETMKFNEMSEAERKAFQLERELGTEKQKREEIESRQKQEAHTRAVEEQKASYAKSMIQSVEKYNLPKNDVVYNLMITTMQQQVAQYGDVDVDAVAQYVSDLLSKELGYKPPTNTPPVTPPAAPAVPPSTEPVNRATKDNQPPRDQSKKKDQKETWAQFKKRLHDEIGE